MKDLNQYTCQFDIVHCRSVRGHVSSSVTNPEVGTDYCIGRELEDSHERTKAGFTPW
jgi:hypothetical protein